MRHYFLGDIHGNSYALEACLSHLERVRADRAYCLGDLAGWLPFGDRTVSRMRALDLPTVAGNHDLMIAGLFTDWPNQVDRMQATAYNAGLLSAAPDVLDYLAGLPLMIERDRFTMVHHSPFHLPPEGEPPTIECFDYLDEPALIECLPAWSSFPKRLIISGHDHIPAVYELTDAADKVGLERVERHVPPSDEPLTVRLKPDSRYWIKAGSVGGPYRDGTPVANTVLYDDDTDTVTLFRIPYPVDKLYKDLASCRFCRNIPTLRRYMELIGKKLDKKSVPK